MKKRIKIFPYCISYFRYNSIMFGPVIGWNNYYNKDFASKSIDFELRLLFFGIGVRFVYMGLK